MRKFGIELEVATSKSSHEIVRALREAGINTENSYYGSRTLENAWKVQPDGSINGWEIVSPPMTDTRELIIVCDVLRKLKCRSSKKCGLHIHHDVSDLTLDQLKNVYKLYAKYERKAIHNMLSPTRKTNFYASPIHTHLNDVLSSNTISEFTRSIHTRYVSLNLKSYVKFGTLEFRGDQGTAQIERILPWLDLTNRMIETAVEKTKIKQLYPNRTNEEALHLMFNELKVSESTEKHYKKWFKYHAERA